jgi:uncharacterized protein YaaN involved in tellurite resistance
MSAISIDDTQSILLFGSDAQSGMQQVSARMLDGVKNKDTGEVGEVMNKVVLEIRGFDVSGLTEEQGWVGKLFSRVSPVALAIQKYETVKSQINALKMDLEHHKGVMLRDSEFLDRLYKEAVSCFQKLEEYILAGEQQLKKWDEEVIPPVAEKAKSSDQLAAEELRKLGAARDMLDRRIHDLKLTQTVTMQSMPSIGMLQDNDNGLVLKIESTIQNTIPLWEIQLAQAVAIANSREAGKAVRKSNDLTNEMLEKNAANLRQGNAEVRTELERGIIDIESLKKAHESLIGTITDSIEIANKGREARANAEAEMKKMNGELVQKLQEAARAA